MRLSTKSRYGLRALFDIAYNAGSQPAQIQDIKAFLGTLTGPVVERIGRN